MFSRKRKHEQEDLEYAMKKGIEESVKQREDSEKQLEAATETASVLRTIRIENHIVRNLREVLNGR